MWEYVLTIHQGAEFFQIIPNSNLAFLLDDVGAVMTLLYGYES